MSWVQLFLEDTSELPVPAAEPSAVALQCHHQDAWGTAPCLSARQDQSKGREKPATLTFATLAFMHWEQREKAAHFHEGLRDPSPSCLGAGPKG